TSCILAVSTTGQNTVHHTIRIAVCQCGRMLALSSTRCAAFSATTRVQQPARPIGFPAPSRTALVVEAAVPKKKTSKMKTAIRKAAWKKEVLPYVELALFKAKRALQAGNRDSTDKDMVIGGQAAQPEGASPESSETQ
ncbi:hypothetical protein Agub_g13900, partial [Astrephomene gubernaculifera]